jgi:hypothetical protein
MIRNFRCSLFIPVLLAIFVVGCKSGSTPTVVSGKVTYNNGPVTGGVIYFGMAGQEASFRGYIKEDGTYSVSDVPQGEMICWIDMEAINPEPAGKPKSATGYAQPGQKDQASANDQNAMLEKMKSMGRAPEGAGGKVGKYMKIPDQYTDKKKSPLKFTTTGGKNTFNPELKD